MSQCPSSEVMPVTSPRARVSMAMPFFMIGHHGVTFGREPDVRSRVAGRVISTCLTVMVVVLSSRLYWFDISGCWSRQGGIGVALPQFPRAQWRAFQLAAQRNKRGAGVNGGLLGNEHRIFGDLEMITSGD